MRIRIRNSLTNIKYTETDEEVDTTKPFKEVIDDLNENLKLKTKEIRYLIINAEGQKEITDYNKSLEDYKFKENDSIQLEPIIKFPVSAYLMACIMYIGPPLVYIIYYKNSSKVDYIQTLATILTLIHYFRRIYEHIFVFNMGVERFPLLNPIIYGIIIYYWVFYGIFGGYYIFNKRYQDKSSLYIIKTVILTLLFLIAEYGNNRAHVYLANLKRKNNNQRDIPRGGLFEYVSYAHYYYELLTWIFFSLIVNTLPAYLFVVASFFTMGIPALEKHKNLKNYFGEKYPKNRKAFIPFIL